MAFRDARCTFAHVLPVAFMLWIVLTIWILYVWLHLLPTLQIWVPADDFDPILHQRGLVQAIVSQLLTALLFISFFRAVWTDPGGVPDTAEWRPESGRGGFKWSHDKGMPIRTEPAPPASLREVKQKTGERRWCKHCRQWKPDRTHHCRVCKSCILRMDHHCPWIANCVGFRNYKFFFLLVTYGALNCWFIIATMAESLCNALIIETPSWNRFLLVFGMTLAVIMAMLLTLFLGLHVWLSSHAMTTIEFCETRHKYLGSASGSMPSYNQGAWENFRTILGPRPIFWLLPIMTPEGDGLTFQLSGRRKEPTKDQDETAALLPHGTEDGTPEPEKVSNPSRDADAAAAPEPQDVAPPEVTGAQAAAV